MSEGSEQNALAWLSELRALRADLRTLRTDRRTQRTDYSVELAEPWTEEALAAFEDREDARLPAEYRVFLCQLGVGQAPSSYNGMVAPCRYSSDSDLARPFPLT